MKFRLLLLLIVLKIETQMVPQPIECIFRHNLYLEQVGRIAGDVYELLRTRIIPAEKLADRQSPEQLRHRYEEVINQLQQWQEQLVQESTQRSEDFLRISQDDYCSQILHDVVQAIAHTIATTKNLIQGGQLQVEDPVQRLADRMKKISQEIHELRTNYSILPPTPQFPMAVELDTAAFCRANIGFTIPAAAAAMELLQPINQPSTLLGDL